MKTHFLKGRDNCYFFPVILFLVLFIVVDNIILLLIIFYRRCPTRCCSYQAAELMLNSHNY